MTVPANPRCLFLARCALDLGHDGLHAPDRTGPGEGRVAAPGAPTAELHVRPLLLPIVLGVAGRQSFGEVPIGPGGGHELEDDLRGEKVTHEEVEVDLWLRYPDGHADVLLEAVVRADQAEHYIGQVLAAFRGLALVREA